MKNMFEIKKVYTTHPDIDVVELKDGTFVGITSETIVHYHGELFADDCETIVRPDKRKFIIVWNDGAQVQQVLKGIEETLEGNKRLTNDVHMLDVGESLNWSDGISQSLSVVRTQ